MQISESGPTILHKRSLAVVVVAALVLSVGGGKAFALDHAQDPSQTVQIAPLAAEALQNLVAPIALYPDALVAIQVLRARAKAAGNLQSTPQQTVVNQDAIISIEPADPNACYVPTYNPLIVYGAPIGIYPGYIYDSLIGAPYISSA